MLTLRWTTRNWSQRELATGIYTHNSWVAVPATLCATSVHTVAVDGAATSAVWMDEESRRIVLAHVCVCVWVRGASGMSVANVAQMNSSVIVQCNTKCKTIIHITGLFASRNFFCFSFLAFSFSFSLFCFAQMWDFSSFRQWTNRMVSQWVRAAGGAPRSELEWIGTSKWYVWLRDKLADCLSSSRIQYLKWFLNDPKTFIRASHTPHPCSPVQLTFGARGMFAYAPHIPTRPYGELTSTICRRLFGLCLLMVELNLRRIEDACTAAKATSNGGGNRLINSYLWPSNSCGFFLWRFYFVILE